MPRAGWRGPSYSGEFPTLGYLIGEWIEAYCVIPDGPQRGQSYSLTREMWMHLLHVYRLHPRAVVHPRYPRPVDGFVHYGAQLRRPQKWGKDPFHAAKAIAHSLGPVMFAGWDADGEPVGMPVPTPWVQIAGTSEENTANTWRPLLRMLREGPLVNEPGLDIGDTRVKLPAGDGWIEPVAAAARSRLGNPITYATFTEPHLMTERDGGLPMARAMKRNLAGMGGSWSEATNAWDPSEHSAAQLTGEARAPGVYLDHREPDLPRLSGPEFGDDEAVRDRLVVKYGDSAREAGGWVDLDGILAVIRDAATGEAQARRYFLDEVTVGTTDAVDALVWDARARRVEEHGALEPDTPIALGFDGSRSADATALIACRVSDGRWFCLGIWTPADYDDHKVPEAEVEQLIHDACRAYQVWHLVADPYRWQHVLDRLVGALGDNPAGKPIVIELPTNVDQRMDDAILLWQAAVKAGPSEWSHDGDPELRAHAMAAALAKGRRKPPRVGDDGQLSEHYVKIVKKKEGWHIDALVAGILAHKGRALAIEQGALSQPEAVEPWVFAE